MGRTEADKPGGTGDGTAAAAADPPPANGSTGSARTSPIGLVNNDNSVMARVRATNDLVEKSIQGIDSLKTLIAEGNVEAKEHQAKLLNRFDRLIDLMTRNNAAGEHNAAVERVRIIRNAVEVLMPALSMFTRAKMVEMIKDSNNVSTLDPAPTEAEIDEVVTEVENERNGNDKKRRNDGAGPVDRNKCRKCGENKRPGESWPEHFKTCKGKAA